MNSWPSFTKHESKIAQKIIASSKVNYWTGNEGKLFEAEFSKWVGVRYAIAVSNGSVALDLALKSLDLKKEDEVIVTPRSFVASATSVVNCGAKPVFADVDLSSGNLSSKTIIRKITKKTKAIICVHLGGLPCEMDEILKLAKKFNLYVIEDCAQAHGAFYKNKSVGSIGHIGAWSFCQDKIITTGGEGGMITTNDKKLWQKMWAYKDHGKNYHSVFKKKHPPGFRWLHDSFGTNFRMTEVQSAIGRYQLRKLKSWNKIRKENASIIQNIALKFPEFLHVPHFPVHSNHAFYRCYIQVKENSLKNKWNRDKIISEIVSHGVPAFSGSCPEIYLEKAFKDSKFSIRRRLPNAKELGETSLCFLVHPTLTKKDMNKVSSVLLKVFTKIKKDNIK
tara:strand:- start:152 stop:1327 length:1176 start_codon:yes stop_codon:yes gene_type:complete